MTTARLLILFDLDGTLVDPAGAITGGIAEALAVTGLPVPPDAELRRMVGPALVRSLMDIGGVPEERVDEVMAVYRAGYRARGMASSRPYPGIVQAVRELRAHGHGVAVATQKPERLARELLALQEMTALFDSIHGADDDELKAALLDGKRTIIAAALAAHAGHYDCAIMVGDRSHDIDGAAANGLDCVAVSWGFGTAEEFSEARPAVVVDTAAALLEYLHGYADKVSRAVVRGRL